MESQNPVEANSTLGQSVATNANRTGGGAFSISGSHLRLKTINKSLLKADIEIEKKKYLSYSYELAYVDDYHEKAYLRYNIYEDEFEFINKNSIYYLAKDVGRKIHFIDLDLTYKVYNLDRELHYFKVYVDGNTSLLAKNRVRYIEAKDAESSYDKAKPPKYKRLRDELYLAVDNRKMIKLRGISKNEFIDCFGDKSNEIKTFLKENKFSHKKIEDVKKIVQYFNTL